MSRRPRSGSTNGTNDGSGSGNVATAQEEEEEDEYKREILRLTAVRRTTAARDDDDRSDGPLEPSSLSANARPTNALTASTTSTSTDATTSTLSNSERPASDSSLSESEACAEVAPPSVQRQEVGRVRNAHGHDGVNVDHRSEEEEGGGRQATTRSVPESAAIPAETKSDPPQGSHSAAPSSSSAASIPSQSQAENLEKVDDAEAGDEALASPSPSPPRSFLDRFAQVEENADKGPASPNGNDARSAAAPTSIPIATASAVRVPSDEFVMVPRSSLMLVPHPSDDSAAHLLVLPNFLLGDDDRDDHEVATAIPMDDSAAGGGVNDEEIRQLHETIAVLQEQLVVQNELVKSLRQSLQNSASSASTSVATTTATESVNAVDSSQPSLAPTPPANGDAPGVDQRKTKRAAPMWFGSKRLLVVAAAMLLTAAVILAIVVPLTSQPMDSIDEPPDGPENGSSVAYPTPTPAGKVVGLKPTFEPVPTTSPYPVASPFPTASPYPTIFNPDSFGDIINNNTESNGSDDVYGYFPPSPIVPTVPTPAPSSSSDTASQSSLSVGAVAGISVAALVAAALILLYVAMKSSASSRRPSDSDNSGAASKPSGAVSSRPPAPFQLGLGDETSITRIPSDDDDDDESDVAGEAQDDGTPQSVSRDRPGASAGSQSRLSALHAKVAALQAKVTRRSEQAQQLVALLEQQQRHHHHQQQPRHPQEPPQRAQREVAGDYIDL